MPLRPSSNAAGDASRLIFLAPSLLGRGWSCWGETSIGVSIYTSSGGVSMSGVNALCGMAFGGRAGSDLSRTIGAVLPGVGTCCRFAFDFFRRRAMSDSWQDMQKMP